MKKPHPRKTDSDVNALLKNGKGKMPSFADTLTPEDEGDLIAYLHSI
jgi:mono/diheme cytochrome c family protein